MMQRVVSGNDAGTWFDDLAREVTEGNEPIAVTRNGEPTVILLSATEYERLRAAQPVAEDWRDLVDQARAQVRAHLGDQPFSSVVEIIREMREEPDAQPHAPLR